MYYPQSEPLNCCYIVSWYTCTSFMAFFSKVLIVVSTVLQSSTKLFLFLYLYSLTPFLTASGIYVPTKTVYITNPPSTFTKTATQTKTATVYRYSATSTVSITSTAIVTSIVTVRTGAQTNSASTNNNNNTLPIILGVVLGISLLVILAFVGVAVMICIV